MRLAWLGATIGILGFAASAAVAQEVPPPVLPGELYVETANHCGVIIVPAELPAGGSVSYSTEYFAKHAWYGRCVDGLVDGEGQFAKPGGPITLQRNQFLLGRNVTSMKSPDAEKQLTTYSSGDQFAQIYDRPKPFGPRWGYDSETVYAPGMKSSIGTHMNKCMEEEKKTRKFGCSYSNNYRAYMLQVVANGDIRTLVCPDPRTSEGCDKLWMIEGKQVFDSIQAFIAPIEAALAQRRARYQALITPAWRAQAEAKRKAVLTNGTASQLTDLAASAAVIGDLAEVVRLYELLFTRFPGSPAIAQARLHLTTLYCLQSAPTPVLKMQEAAEVTKIFQSEPCRRTGVAEPLLFTSKIVLDMTKYRAETDAQFAENWANYQAQRRTERDAYWGAMLGVVTGIIANQVTQSAPVTTYSGGAASTPSYAPPLENPYSEGGATSPGYSPPSSGTSSGSSNSGYPSPGIASGPPTAENQGMFRVDPVASCLQYELLPEVVGRKYYQGRNNCNYAIEVWIKAHLDGQWNDSYDLNGEIGPYATKRMDYGILANHFYATIVIACPARSTLERQLGKKVTGVYTKHDTEIGCWSMLENTGVGIAN